LRFSFLGARIFFRDDAKKKEEEKPVEKAPEATEENGTAESEFVNGTSEDTNEFYQSSGPPPIPPRD